MLELKRKTKIDLADPLDYRWFVSKHKELCENPDFVLDTTLMRWFAAHYVLVYDELPVFLNRYILRIKPNKKTFFSYILEV